MTWRHNRFIADGAGIAVVLAAVAGLAAFRQTYVEPPGWGAICAAAAPPLVCAPLQALGWLQYWYLWGAAALALGLAAFLTGRLPLAVAAVTLGAMAVLNYNATWGVLGAALGVWVWIRRGAG
jgi:hypothetical protein